MATVWWYPGRNSAKIKIVKPHANQEQVRTVSTHHLDGLHWVEYLPMAHRLMLLLSSNREHVRYSAVLLSNLYLVKQVPIVQASQYLIGWISAIGD